MHGPVGYHRDPQWPAQMSFYFLWVWDCSAYKLLTILCSASWTWTLYILISSQQKCKGTPACFWSFSLCTSLSGDFTVQSQYAPPRFLYPQLSKTLRICLDSLFLCPWFKNALSRKWVLIGLILFPFSQGSLFLLSIVQWLKTIDAYILFS